MESEINDRGYSIYDPASAYHWIPKAIRDKRKKEHMTPGSLLTSEDFLKGMKYQKPEIKREKVMTFMFDAINKKTEGWKHGCKQCSSCHGCR